MPPLLEKLDSETGDESALRERFREYWDDRSKVLFILLGDMSSVASDARDFAGNNPAVRRVLFIPEPQWLDDPSLADLTGGDSDIVACSVSLGRQIIARLTVEDVQRSIRIDNAFADAEIAGA